MATVGEATENGYAERLMRTIQEDVRLHDYDDFHAAYQHIGRFLDDIYQHKRIHSVLGYLTPAEFEIQWLQHCAMTMSAPLETP
jgi:putative transposase